MGKISQYCSSSLLRGDLQPLVIEFRPQEIDLSGKTSAGGNGNGGDGNVSEGRGDGALEGEGAGVCNGGDDVGGGEDGAERG